jgi:hypothetical protein
MMQKWSNLYNNLANACNFWETDKLLVSLNDMKIVYEFEKPFQWHPP